MGKKTIRYALLCLAALLFAGCAGHPYKPSELSNVIEIPGKDQKALYHKTRQWFSQYFVSGKSVVDYENPETGTIIANGTSRVGSDPFGIIKYNIKFNIRIDTKDGKLRALTTILEHTNTDSEKTYTVGYVSQDREGEAIKHVGTIIADLETYLNAKNIDSKSNW